MIYKCQNCGANTVYAPEKNGMCCPHCDSMDSEVKEPGNGLLSCVTCGAPISPKEFDSAYKCGHCGAYMIFEERVEGDLEPHLILPFMVSKNKAKEILKQTFGKKIFLPDNFLKEAFLDTMEGIYVPFYLYDYDCYYDYQGTGKKIRTWTSGNTEYTETSIYRIIREMDMDFSKIPVDASIKMDDQLMDLLEPFRYDQLRDFDTKYMSGFFGEMRNMSPDVIEPRAKMKAQSDAEALMQSTISGYSSVTPEHRDLRLRNTAQNYTLLPVWKYVYKYRGKEYEFDLNGQTGKLVGATPISVHKVVAYAITLFAGLSSIFLLALRILEVIL